MQSTIYTNMFKVPILFTLERDSKPATVLYGVQFHPKTPLVETGFEPAKLMHRILKPTPLTARELYWLVFKVHRHSTHPSRRGWASHVYYPGKDVSNSILMPAGVNRAFPFIDTLSYFVLYYIKSGACLDARRVRFFEVQDPLARFV